MVFNQLQKHKALDDLFCIELKPLNHCSNGKGALCRNYTTDESVWFKYPDVPERYGILLTANNLLIVDIDKPNLINWKIFKSTFTVKTGSGGYHLYYKNPMKLTSNHSWEYGEIKTSGHVVGPDVLHCSGNHYKVINNIGIQSIFQNDFMNSMLQHSAAGAAPALLQQQHLETKQVYEIDKTIYPSWQTTFAEMEWILKEKTGVIFKQNNDRSAKDFLIALTLAEHGIDENLIFVALKKWGTSKVLERGPSYVKHTVIAAVNVALQNNQSIFKERLGGEKIPDINETKVYFKRNNGSKYFKLSEKEMQRGGETINFLSFEKGEIWKSDDGNIFYSPKGRQSVTLPQNEELLHAIGNALLTYPNVVQPEQTELKEEPKENKKK